MKSMKSSDASIMRMKLDCSFDNYLAYSKIFHEDHSPLNWSVWGEHFLIRTDMLWTSRVNNPAIFITDELSVTDRTSHLPSSPSDSSMKLASCCFFLRVQQSALMCLFLWTSCTRNYCITLHVKLSSLLFFLVKCTCPESSWWDSPINCLSILSLLTRCSLTLIVDLPP